MNTPIPFPLARRVSLVRHIAASLISLQGEAANRYWREWVAGSVAEMKADGIEIGQIRIAILDLQHAVQEELNAKCAQAAHTAGS